MSDQREHEVRDDEDVEAHKKMKAQDEPVSHEESDDVEAHVHKKV